MIEIIFLLVALCFIVPAFFGAPYVPTLKSHVPVAFDLLNLAPGQTMLELGCGDGRIVREAAKRGYKVVGYELNPCLAALAWLRTIRYRKQVTIIWGNFFKKELPRADGIFCFIMPRFMPAINEKIMNSDLSPVKLVSFSFPIPNKQPAAQKNSVLLYTYDNEEILATV